MSHRKTKGFNRQSEKGIFFPMKRLIVYDLDGTLVDTRADIVSSVNFMLSEMGAKRLETSEVEPFVGKGLHYLVAGCLKTDEKSQVEAGAKIFRKHYGEHMLDHSQLYSGAQEFLDYFKERKQAVITNKPNPFTDQMLAALKISDFLCAQIAGNSSYPQKPDPRALIAVMEIAKASREETLLIGDSAIDRQFGKRAGVDTVLITHGFSGRNELESQAPEVLTDSFHELLDITKRKGW
ncbi:MAG: HAD hydrolase-like protein [Candidatus Omnitrophota bacterium]|nr:HAD hydrolase-like protein [Candidatus Omnitrophota bacterium]